MAYRAIPFDAVKAGALVSGYLIRALRDNLLWLNNVGAAIGLQLNATTGHGHTTVTKASSYNFDDEITTTTGVNDSIDFVFAGASIASTLFAATLDAGTRTPPVHAAHVQTKMRAAASATTYIDVTYDVTTGSPTRGRFRIQNTAPLGGAHLPVLKLLFGTGVNAATSAASAMQYVGGNGQGDLIGGTGYTSVGGFADSYLQDTILLGDGGLLDDDAFEDEAFTAAKFKAGIVTNPAFQDDSVAGSGGSGGSGAGQIADLAVTGAKIGPADESETQDIPAGVPITFHLTLATGGASRQPGVTPSSTDPCIASDLEIVTMTFITDHWAIAVLNASAVTKHNVKLAGM